MAAPALVWNSFRGREAARGRGIRNINPTKTQRIRGNVFDGNWTVVTNRQRLAWTVADSTVTMQQAQARLHANEFVAAVGFSGSATLQNGTQDVNLQDLPLPMGNGVKPRFFLVRTTLGGTTGELSYQLTTDKLTINSSSSSDTSTVLWVMVF